MVDKEDQTVPGFCTLCICKATVADLRVIEHNVDTVCREGIYLVPSRFILPQSWRKILVAGGELDNDLIIVAEVKGRVVGHGRMFTTAGTSAHVADLGMALIPGFRDQGIGSRMVTYMLHWARQKGLRKVTLGVFASNKRAIHVYEKFGFAVEGVLAEQHDVDGQYVDELLMAKFL